MRNKELYQATFSQVRPSSDIRWEDLMAKKRKRHRRRPLLLAAAVVGVLAALTCAAVAVNFMGLGDLLLPGRQSGQSSPGGQEERVLSLSGYMDTPESQALAEWETFRSDYDPTGSILAAVGNTLDEDLLPYTCYTVYTDEMAHALEDIAQAHGLTLHERRVSLDEYPELWDSCGDFWDGGQRLGGYLYEDGGFAFDGEARLPGGGTLSFQFRRSVKGTLNEATLFLRDLSQFREWVHPTPEGAAVTLALGPDRALVLADLEDCFVTLTVLEGSAGGLTQADLEAFADNFRFSTLSPVTAPELPAPTPVLSPAPSPTAKTAREAYAAVLRDLLYRSLLPDGAVADGFLEDISLNQFSVFDVDADGSEELILLYTTAYSASMQGSLLSFDPRHTGSGNPVSIRLLEFPSFTFYDNAALRVSASHNQSWGEMWPYTLYRWTGQAYEAVALVWSDDRAVMEDAGLGENYPAQADTSGSGTVYYVRPAGEQVEPRPMDVTEYRAWWDGVMGLAQALDVPYQSLTEENIAAMEHGS